MNQVIDAIKMRRSVRSYESRSVSADICWVGFGSMVTDNAEITKLLELRDDEKIYGPIVLGYPKVYTGPPQKKGPVVKWI